MRQVDLGNAEVGDLGVAFRRQQNVARLDIAVHHALLVGVVERFGELFDQLQGAGQRQYLLARENLVQRFAGDIFENNVGVVMLFILAHIEHGDDAGMDQPAHGLRFVQEAVAELLPPFRWAGRAAGWS